MKANGYHGETQYRRTPTAVTAKDAITVLNVRSNGTTKPHAFLGEISQRLGHHGLIIDLISSSQQMVSLAVSTDNSSDYHSSIDEAVMELNEIGIVTVARHMSIVSVVGHKMRNMVGVAGKSIPRRTQSWEFADKTIAGEIFGALARARVNIYLISQGASEINISSVSLLRFMSRKTC
jgi:aspartate kinase